LFGLELEGGGFKGLGAGCESFLEFVDSRLEWVFVNWLFVWLGREPVIGFLELLIGGFCLVKLELEFAGFGREVGNELLELWENGFKDGIGSWFVLGTFDPVTDAVEVLKILECLGEFLLKGLLIEGGYVFLVGKWVGRFCASRAEDC
jgi:hypothetical protein